MTLVIANRNAKFGAVHLPVGSCPRQQGEQKELGLFRRTFNNLGFYESGTFLNSSAQPSGIRPR